MSLAKESTLVQMYDEELLISHNDLKGFTITLFFHPLYIIKDIF